MTGVDRGHPHLLHGHHTEGVSVNSHILRHSACVPDKWHWLEVTEKLSNKGHFRKKHGEITDALKQNITKTYGQKP